MQVVSAACLAVGFGLIIQACGGGASSSAGGQQQVPVEPDTVVRTGEVMVVGNEPFTHYELETTQGRYHLALPEDSSLSLSTTGPTYLEVTGYVEADSGKSGGNPILQALTWRKASAADCKVTETWDDMPDC